MRDLSIYIHIPFCVRKCLYCDFLSFPVRGAETGGEEELERYQRLLLEEIKQQSIFYKEHQVVSIFLGGGTPSLMTEEQMREIMEQIRAYYRVAEEAEITVEINPGTVTEEKLRGYITCGINRISIGLQSADNEELVRIGRIHTYEQFLETYRAARGVGFTNINIDLMAALPGQSIVSYHNTLRRVVSLRPEHISAYSLILEEGTPLYEKRDRYVFPSEEEDRQMYLMTGRYLSAHGYHRYEISNYAREGYECRHNKVYWQRGDYVGFGLGASSMVEDVRWSNPAGMEEYAAYAVQARTPAASVHAETSADAVRPGENASSVCPHRERLTVREQMEEFMFLGLRMMCGVEREAFGEKFGQPIEQVYGDVINRLCTQGLLMTEHGRIRLTERGIDISNYVMAEFLFD
ncbi:MAG: oxygen-independent coproporphyrinogen III oxidase [Lachnospiraceae bacterium]|nr:oxygen-independent coproporphyrinogen III oxidase [Lachnospiraceae bacterium]